MKKQLAFITMLIVALAAAPCFAGQTEKEPTPYELYAESNALVSDFDSALIKTDVALEMEMAVEGESMVLEILVAGAVKVVMNSETDMDMMMEMSTSLMGMDIDMTGYYTDGMMYMNSMEEKIKMPMPIDEALKQANMIDISFEEDSIKEQSMTEVEGGTEVSFVLDATLMGDEVMSQLGDLSGLLGTEMDMTLSDITVIALIDEDGFLKKIDMEFSATVGVADEEMKMSISATVEIVEIGDQEIEFPEDLDDYVLAEVPAE